jgi:hypothetical protein
MITLTFYGLNMYALGDLSSVLLNRLSQTLKIEEKLITLRAIESMIFYKGIDQNTWEVMVDIRMLESMKQHEQKIMQLLQDVLKEQTIHLTCDFIYVKESSRVQFISNDYPRYITDDNQVIVGHTHEKTTDVFTGNIFQNVQDKLNQTATLFENEQEEHTCTCGKHEGACDCGSHQD